MRKLKSYRNTNLKKDQLINEQIQISTNHETILRTLQVRYTPITRPKHIKLQNTVADNTQPKQSK